MQSFLGYPGGKSRSAKTILDLAGEVEFDRYAEPFCGGFAVGLNVAELYDCDILMNDLDSDLMSLWTAVIRYPEQLCSEIQDYDIYPELFYELRDEFRNPRPLPKSPGKVVERASDKLVLHKISFSNLGEMSGSPVGGREQKGAWKFDCRWNPDLICKRIMRVHELLAGRTQLFCEPYQKFFQRIGKSDWVYIDPPYVEGGPKCYKHSFDEDLHRRLANTLSVSKFKWFMTYDNVELVRELYDDCYIQEFNLKYAMSSTCRAGKKHRVANELLISNY